MPACSVHIRVDIVLHQEDPRAHCNNITYTKESEVFISSAVDLCNPQRIYLPKSLLAHY